MFGKSVAAAGLAVAMAAGSAFGGTMKLTTQAAGDAQYAWNSKCGPYGYLTGTETIGVGLGMYGRWGNDYTIAIFEVPIAPLAGYALSEATLTVNSIGFSTWYYYGSANIGWQNSDGATGDVVADGRGSLGMGETVAQIWNSDWGHDASGLRSFNVLAQVQADLAAGRTFSTFVINGSRDTGGGIYTAEGGAAPYIVASSEMIPEPASIGLLAIGGIGAIIRRRRTA